MEGSQQVEEPRILGRQVVDSQQQVVVLRSQVEVQNSLQVAKSRSREPSLSSPWILVAARLDSQEALLQVLLVEHGHNLLVLGKQQADAHHSLLVEDSREPPWLCWHCRS